MNQTLQIGDIKLPCREVIVDEQTFFAPKGVARNNRNKCWQVKITRHGVSVLTGQYTDYQYGGAAKSLDEAIKFIAGSGVIEAPSTLKLTSRITLFWSYSGANVLGLSASLYNPDTKRSTTQYLISQAKLAAGKTDSLKAKLLSVYVKEWRELNNLSESAVPMSRKIQLGQQAVALMESDDWREFMKVGAELATHKA